MGLDVDRDAWCTETAAVWTRIGTDEDRQIIPETIASERPFAFRLSSHVNLDHRNTVDPVGREADMPKIDVAAATERIGVGYPEPFAALTAHRSRRKLGDAGGVTDFGANLTRLPPGEWSSQRHWHSHEDEFVYVLEGELVLIEDGGETPLRAGDAAGFPKGSGNGHHMINRSQSDAVYLEIGSRHPEDVTTCSDVDMVSTNADGRFLRKDGTPYTGR